MYTIAFFSLIAIFVFVKALECVNKNYTKIFADNYEWEDFWISNLGIFRGLVYLLNVAPVVFLWLIAKDSCVGDLISLVVAGSVFVFCFICLTTGYHNAETYEGDYPTYWQIFREEFWKFFWVYPNRDLTKLFFEHVKKNGQSSYRFIAISWLIYIGLFFHILINPFLD